VSDVKRTGLVCPACKRPVAHIEHETPQGLTFYCPACGNRWSAETPGAPKY
jgi:hypothetical protein